MLLNRHTAVAVIVLVSRWSKASLVSHASCDDVDITAHVSGRVIVSVDHGKLLEVHQSVGDMAKAYGVTVN